ncbi:MAG TPA: DNA repair protein RadC [Stellaceae bacterium]|nr:DNA repair protein RadC [Stellaceae bacterium]
MPFSISEQNGRLAVRAPYHPDFPARARMLGGEWDRSRRIWLFDPSDRDRVQALCREIYGGGEIEPFPTPRASNSRQFAEAAPQPHYFGHRERLRERMMAAGPENLPDYELLEVILFAARARGDVKPVAKSLIAQFGGFAAVMAAEPAALAEAGLNLPGIVAIKAAREASLRLKHAELQERPVVNSWDKLIDYCSAHVAHGTVEEFHILFLDRKNVLLKHERQQRGTIDHTPVYPREVVKRALELGASAMILVHNHPSGDPTPSTADITITKEIKKAAGALGLALHDHLIIARDRHVSFRDLKLL